MKSLIKILPFVLFFLTACNGTNKNNPAHLVNNPKSATEAANKKTAGITFKSTEHDFGRMIQGEKVIHVFRFTNTGDADLILSQVSASCGCTASKYTKTAIKPGDEGTIEVTFDSGGQRGIQNKTITVISNGQPQSTILRVKGQVSTPESY
jgi:hypothetical protein